MSVTCVIVDGPLPAFPPGTIAPRRVGAVGAVVVFDGIVRGSEVDGDRSTEIEAIDYEIYEPMASREMGRLGANLLVECGVDAINIWHSRGRVPVGATSFRLIVMAAHRKEALQAMDRFIDRMKADVPIWKRAVRSNAAASSADR